MSRSTDLDPLPRQYVASISNNNNNNRTAATCILGDPLLRNAASQAASLTDNASLTSLTEDTSHNSLTDTTLTSLADTLLRGLIVQPPSVSLMTEAIRRTAINQQSEQQQHQQQLLQQILPNAPSFLHSRLDPSTVLASRSEELQDANALLLALQALASANASHPHVFVSNDPSATSSISSGNSSGDSSGNSSGNSTVSRNSESLAANSIPSLESNSSIAHASHHSYLTQATLEVMAKQQLLNEQATTKTNQNWPCKRQKTADQNQYDYQVEKWDAQFNELLAFKAQHGHCRVPQNYEGNPALSHWVKRQRYQYKCKREGKVSGISESRIQRLEQIGFVWDAQELLWQTRFDELKVFRLKHGHCNVPYNYDLNRKLPTWIKCQRRQYKLRHEEQPSNMTRERIDLLHGLEFKWGQRESTVAGR
jgi:hypothetical protein